MPATGKLHEMYRDGDLELSFDYYAELRRKTGREAPAPADWVEAFERLRDYLGQLDSSGRNVVFMDELSWLDTHRSGFLPAFEWFRNDWESTGNDLVFIVCGSVTTWMVKHFADNKGGLF